MNWSWGATIDLQLKKFQGEHWISKNFSLVSLWTEFLDECCSSVHLEEAVKSVPKKEATWDKQIEDTREFIFRNEDSARSGGLGARVSCRRIS